MFGPEMFGHLVANTEVWLIECEVRGTTRYFVRMEFESFTKSVVWTKKRSNAKQFQKKEEVQGAWKLIDQRGTPKKHRLAHILEEAAKG